MIEIRTARPDDADAIAAAHAAAWRAGYRGVFPDDQLDAASFVPARSTRWRERIERAGPRPDRELDLLLACEVDGRVVGFGHVGDEDPGGGTTHHEPTGRGELYSCYLHPDAWGTGAAGALLTACEAALAGAFRDAVLWTVRDGARQRRFYERSGWSCGAGPEVELATWTCTLTPDAEPTQATIIQYRRRFG